MYQKSHIKCEMMVGAHINNSRSRKDFECNHANANALCRTGSLCHFLEWNFVPVAIVQSIEQRFVLVVKVLFVQ